MVRVAAAYAFALSVSLVCCSIARGQSLDFKVDGPTTVTEGEYVELTVMFPEGVKADVDFTPIEEAEFGVHPVVSETLVDGKLTASVVGRKCTFSARCHGERDLVVVATAFANFDGIPRLKSLKHRIHVTAKQGPKVPPTPPPNDPDDLGPVVPLPGAALPQSDVDKIAAILDNVVDRIEALEKRATAVSVKAPALAYGASQPASAPVEPLVRRAGTIPTLPTGGRWNIEGDWNPTWQETLAHLRGPNHASYSAQYEPLEQYTHGQLRWIHDQHHDGAKAPASSRAVSVYTQPVVGYQPTAAGIRVLNASPCPGGVCPTSGSSRAYSRGFFGWRR